jgi:4-amino-4-deoxy-L-arabinose transferase-like glycosyltransferase
MPLPARATALILALAAALLLFRLGEVPLVGSDEPRYVRVAVEMARAGAWVRPTLQGEPWLEKPALYYWMAGLAFRLLGENEAAARLPAVGAGLLSVAATGLFGARLLGSRVGLRAALLSATSLLPFVYAKAASMDMLLAAPVTVATGLVGLRLLGIAGPGAAVGAGVMAGLATLAKGLLGVVLPALVALGYVAASGQWRRLRGVATPGALLGFTLTAGPWYAAVAADQGWRFVDVFIVDHHLQRLVSTVHDHPGSVLYYLPIVLLGLFPWSGLLVPGLLSASPRRSSVDLFLLLWAGLPLCFLSLAGSKLPGYVLPCLPPLAILMARAADELAGSRDEPSPWPRVVALVGLGTGAVLAGLAPALLRAEGDPLWTRVLTLSAWCVLVPYLFARTVTTRPAAALGLLHVGAAGFTLLLTMQAVAFLPRHESGRDVLRPARGREVLVFDAWRTNWMAGYFYNDGRVRPIEGLADLETAATAGPVLVLCSPDRRAEVGRKPGLSTRLLATGPRGDALLEVRLTPGDRGP